MQLNFLNGSVTLLFNQSHCPSHIPVWPYEHHKIKLFLFWKVLDYMLTLQDITPIFSTLFLLKKCH